MSAGEPTTDKEIDAWNEAHKKHPTVHERSASVELILGRTEVVVQPDIDRIMQHIDGAFNDNGYALDSVQDIIIRTCIQDELDYQEENR